MKIAQIGIDLSINSTGLSMYFKDKDNLIVKFFQICSTETKVSGSVQLVTYKRVPKIDQYSTDDLITVIDAASLANCINKLLIKLQSIYKFDKIDVRMEGSIMSTGGFGRGSSSKGRLNDLTVFNSTTKRMLLLHPLVHSIAIIAPKALKKHFTNNGNAKKERMIETFLKLFPDFDKSRKVKIDDIADAYALSCAQIQDSTKYIKPQS